MSKENKRSRRGQTGKQGENSAKIRKTEVDTIKEPTIATLELTDGTLFSGYSFGANKSMAGEVVFNTGMVGYPEALTDPSYAGQILVLTFPLIGNYGVPSDDIDEIGLSKNFESSKIHIKGLVVATYTSDHSHWASQRSLGTWLREHGVPAIYGVDTRAITKVIRESGAVLGKINYPDDQIDFYNPNITNLVSEVSTKEVKVYGEGQRPRILVYDMGIKNNIIRYLVQVNKVCCIVVPFEYPLEENPEKIEYEGLFLSNGPGDPAMCTTTIASVNWAISRPKEEIKPIFGICLGNQILSLASGAKTFKMKYGNRGANQPAIDLRTGRCYITPQNHGYAVDQKALKADWKPLFLNANDFTNEGIIHTTKPFFSAQFHPEAAGGPMDTAFLFEMFVEMVNGVPPRLTLLDPMVYIPSQSPARKVLLIGSGGLSIGQAGEFDYSGSQAIKALKEEGLEVILINPNIATVQTSTKSDVGGGFFADKVYFLPVTAAHVLTVIQKENPDSIIVSMGGQTALNVGIELYDNGDLERHNVRVLGTQIPVIVATEDREIFSEKLTEIHETLALSFPATTIEEAIVAANKIGFPVLVRAAFALGGLGSGFADNEEELASLAEKAFSCSKQILIDMDLRGWKEVEYEVVRDARDNCITVCNMENFDPLGVHTGDSIVVAPSQTLSNSEYYKLRSTALKVVRHLGIVGECNIQYALNPNSEQYCIIEVNARLSRSSALASKATGYPLAYVAAKLSLGIDLVSIRNSVTKTTTACFEPSLDYCVIKMPRWDLHKFDKVSKHLGSSMKSVGEVMSIGRSFEEAIQKAVRMVSPGSLGLEALANSQDMSKEDLDNLLSKPTDKRLYAVQAALDKGYTVDQVHNLSKIDRWFLSRLKNISNLRHFCQNSTTKFENVNTYQLRLLKQNGFSDTQIAGYMKSNPSIVRRRRQQLGIVPVVKQIDTHAAEFPAQTNYLYMTYHGTENDVQDQPNGVIVLGCGAYCIGSSVEFDWSAVSCVRQIRALGKQAVVINYNPETVSTDYDECDRLYFEELTLERVLDIYEHEAAAGIIVSVGGQVAQNIATPLKEAGANIYGTDPDDIDRAEDRQKFSDLLDSIDVDQPQWRELATVEDAIQFANEVKFPVLVRPSFVLSGAAMNVAVTENQLVRFLKEATDVSGDKPVVVSKFITNAKEVEFDAVAQNGHLLNYAISEHVENAGVHSGDATLVLPAQKIYQETTRQVKKIGMAIAKALNITGPFNIQLMARDNEVKVIECNLRCSRTFPFVSKTLNCNFITLATKAMLGLAVKPYQISLNDLDYVAVKAPMFSFTRLRGADPTLGVEMSSTGEVACFGDTVHEAFILALESTGFKIPKPSKTTGILLSIAESDLDRFHMDARHEFRDHIKQLEILGFLLYGTPGTAAYYRRLGVNITSLSKPKKTSAAAADQMEVDSADNDEVAIDDMVIDFIKSGKIDMVINVPEGSNKDGVVSNGYLIRRTTVDFGISLITNIKVAKLLVECFMRGDKPKPKHIHEYYDMDKLQHIQR